MKEKRSHVFKHQGLEENTRPDLQKKMRLH